MRYFQHSLDLLQKPEVHFSSSQVKTLHSYSDSHCNEDILRATMSIFSRILLSRQGGLVQRGMHFYVIWISQDGNQWPFERVIQACSIHSLNQTTFMYKRARKQVLYPLNLKVNIACGHFFWPRNPHSRLKIKIFHALEPPLLQRL